MKDPTATRLAGLIRSIPDFPRPGILFRDLTTLVADPEGFRLAVEALAATWREARIAKVVGIESRGFLFAAPVALALGAGFVPARKPGKLPARVIREEYALEYGADALEMHEDAIRPGERVLVVDDLLATGGTARAVLALVRRLGGDPAAAAFVVELDALHGREKLVPVPVVSLVHYREDE